MNRNFFLIFSTFSAFSTEVHVLYSMYRILIFPYRPEETKIHPAKQQRLKMTIIYEANVIMNNETKYLIKPEIGKSFWSMKSETMRQILVF